eukprot:gene9873-10919_t
MKSRSTVSGKGKTKVAVTSSGLSWLFTAVLVFFSFFGGIYIGTIFIGSQTHSDGNNNQQGLPGTKNILQSWSSSSPSFPSPPIAQQSLPPGRLRGSSESKGRLPEDSSANHQQQQQLRAEHSITHQIKTTKTVLSSSSFPAVGSHGGENDGIIRHSLHIDQRSFVEYPKSLDNENIVVSAWIYLDDGNDNPIFDKDMRTIFSNKLPGCGTTDGQHGISMYINAWQNPDHRLYVEYGSLESGCNKVDSGSKTFQFHQWYHVAAFFSTTEVILYIDGKEANRVTVNDPHISQLVNPFLIGHYAKGGDDVAYPLYGNLSHLAVLHTTTVTEDVIRSLQDVDSAKNIDGLKAFFPLTSVHVSDGAVDEIVGGGTGHYELPLNGKQVKGVSIALVDGRTTTVITQEMKDESDRLGRERREKIKDGMRHAWTGYKNHAWGRDELRPISGSSKDNWGGMGMTLVDSLDTLWVMGMKEEFEEARRWVETSLTFAHAGTVSVFETTIRALGGLLSAYDLSKEQIFLTKAKELADRLLPAFNTPTGIPLSHVNLNSGAGGGGWAGSNAVLSELGTLQLEFRYLAKQVGDSKYDTISMKAIKKVLANNPSTGLYPIRIRVGDGGFGDSMITFGALGDSFYEYLLKLWVQTGRKEQWLRDAYDKAMDGAIEHMLLTSRQSGLAFLADWNTRSHNRKMDHLVCFMPGLLTLGAYTSLEGLQSPRAQRDLAVARALMYTCREMYHRTPTGIAPEYVTFPEGGDMSAGPNAEFYILRPETAESLFVMAQLTGEPIYRQWAWEIWEAIDHTLRTPLAYASLHNVYQASSLEDRMESFFLAETMKYLYLAQDPDKAIDLTKHVFNTEAHPLSIFE